MIQSTEKKPLTVYTEFLLQQKIKFTLNPMIHGQIVCIRVFGSGGIDYEVTYIDADGQIKNGIFHDYEMVLDEE
jgi:hypothetical protein